MNQKKTAVTNKETESVIKNPQTQKGLAPDGSTHKFHQISLKNQHQLFFKNFAPKNEERILLTSFYEVSITPIQDPKTLQTNKYLYECIYKFNKKYLN